MMNQRRLINHLKILKFFDDEVSLPLELGSEVP